MRGRSRIGSACWSILLAAILAQGLLSSPRSADANEAESGTLRPSYEPAPVPEEEVYSTDYFFALSRTVADSTLATAAKVPLFLLTIPVDTALLPIAAIAGFFTGD